MAGVRIRHATEKSCTYILVDASQPYHTPFNCPACFTTHLFKTYHLTLDDTGACLVSPEIVERLKKLGPATGFSIESEVKKPPRQLVGMAGRDNHRKPLAFNRQLIEPK
jgi:hypothetical protein